MIPAFQCCCFPELKVSWKERDLQNILVGFNYIGLQPSTSMYNFDINLVFTSFRWHNTRVWRVTRSKDGRVRWWRWRPLWHYLQQSNIWKMSRRDDNNRRPAATSTAVPKVGSFSILKLFLTIQFGIPSKSYFLDLKLPDFWAFWQKLILVLANKLFIFITLPF